MTRRGKKAIVTASSIALAIPMWFVFRDQWLATMIGVAYGVAHTIAHVVVEDR